jgi:hypothetical protein
LKGKREPPRAYSMCSAPHQRYRELIPDLDARVIYVCRRGISKFGREVAKEKG